MMAKNSVQEIASAIAAKHGLSLQDAEAFVTSFFDLINDGLHSEKTVKVKGLGTFKVVDVRERESVNVNTGERVLIESHSKITFTADSVMRDLVNKPFAQFETVVLNDGVELEDMAKIQSSDDSDLKDDDMDVIDADSDAEDSDEDVIQEDKTDSRKVVIADYDLSHLEQDSDKDDGHTDNGALEETDDAERKEKSELSVGGGEQIAEPLKQAAVAVDNGTNVMTSVSDDSSAEGLSDENAEADSSDECADGINSRDDSEICDNDTANELTAEPDNSETNVLNTEHGEQDVNDGKEGGTSDYVEKAGNSLSMVWYYWVLIMLIVAVASFFGGYYWERYNAKPIIKYVTVRQAVAPTSASKTDTVRNNDSIETYDGKLKQQAGTPVSSKSDITDKSKTQSKTETSASDALPVTQNMKNAAMAVKTGAYRIAGTDRVITVKKGETLRKISKFYLGEGMECYIMVHNGVTDVKEGMRLKIPKLVNKRRK